MVVKMKKEIARKIKSFRSNSSGIASVEAAMIMPFLIVIIFGCIEFSRSFFIQSELQRAVNITSRYVMLNPNASETTFKNELTANLDTVNSSQISSVEAVKQTDADGNNTVQLTVRYSYTFLIPYISSDPLELVATQTIVTS